jgi:phospholipid N-methyltransferase
MSKNPALFLTRFVRHPFQVGAVAPSSAALAELAVVGLPESGDPVVVELGAGTGAFTGLIQDRLAGRGYHLAVEVDPVFASVLRRRHPRVDVAVADAVRLPELVALRGLTRVDVVVSGLPWAAFGPAQAGATLTNVASVMGPHAAFSTFAYVHALWSPPARRLQAGLEAVFEEVVPSRTVWANLPPALVYHARRPRQRLPQRRGDRPELAVDEPEPVR